MRIISFCADGIREAAKKGFYEWVIDQDADFICVIDTSCNDCCRGIRQLLNEDNSRSVEDYFAKS